MVTVTTIISRIISGGEKVVYPVQERIIEITWRVIIHAPKVDYRKVKFLPARELIALWDSLPRISRIDTTFQPCNFLGSLSPVDTVLVTELNAILIGYKRSLPKEGKLRWLVSRSIPQHRTLFPVYIGEVAGTRYRLEIYSACLFRILRVQLAPWRATSRQSLVNHSRVLFPLVTTKASSFRSIYTKTCIKDLRFRLFLYRNTINISWNINCRVNSDYSTRGGQVRVISLF